MRPATADRDGAGLSRRGFLMAGALGSAGWLVGCSAPDPLDRLGKGEDFSTPQEIALNAWVRIAPDSRVIVAVPRVEMGQGVQHALARLVAEELDADWSRVEVAFAPVGRVYANSAVLLNASIFDAEDTGLIAGSVQALLQRAGVWLSLQATGGSASVRDAWEPMRHAGAAARALLLAAAARRWQVDAASLQVRDSRIRHAASGREAGFGELVSTASMLPIPSTIRPKPASQWTLIGRDGPWLRPAGMLDGRLVYGTDVRLPGMLHAAILHAPVLGGRLLSFDPDPVLKQPGVRAAFALDDRAVVVVADRHWRAQRALQALKPRWEDGPHRALDSEGLRARLRAAVDGDEAGVAFRDDGDAAQALSLAARRIEALYEVPFLAHAALEPVNCTAQVADGRVQLWCPTQVPVLARLRAARTARVLPSAVTLHLTAVGGGFGRRLEVDMVDEAVAIALRTQGAPVQLLWSREEDFRHDVYRPAAQSRLVAGLDGQGRLQAWSHRVAAPSVTEGFTDRLAGIGLPALPDKFSVEGAFDLPYEIPNLLVRQLRVSTPVPVGYWRSVGHSYNAFFTECFLDEVAQASRRDPVGFRRALLERHPRHRRVLDEVARRAGWGEPLPAGRARGVALHASFGSICAQVAEVSIEGGAVRVHRVVVALDCGTVVHPDGVRAQLEGAVAFGLSATLRGEITLRGGAVEQADFAAYGVLRLHEMPEVQVHLLPSEQPPGGVGEVGVPPVAPAVVNALAVLTGRRIRRLPVRLAELGLSSGTSPGSAGRG